MVLAIGISSKAIKDTDNVVICKRSIIPKIGADALNLGNKTGKLIMLSMLFIKSHCSIYFS